MNCCVFAGHREIYEKGVEHRVYEAVYELIESKTAFCFYTGGMGEFDQMCAGAVQRIKREYTHKEIKLILVEPYMKQSINVHGSVLLARYDEIVIPEELADCHYKKAITLRNRWMTDQSQYMIAYVAKRYGGAYASMKYAEKKGLSVRNLYHGLLK